MAFIPADWHWLVLGMGLLLVEMFVSTFFVLWFGLAAIAVAAVLWAGWDAGFAQQILAWTVLSGLMTFLWFRFLRPLMRDRTKAGMSREAALGVTGQVIEAPVEGRRGRVRFPVPLLGDDEWDFICDTPAAVGDRVTVREISGNTLIVHKRP